MTEITTNAIRIATIIGAVVAMVVIEIVVHGIVWITTS